MAITSVAVPGPWWTLLSYASEEVLSEGLRVRVPLGNSFRVGLTAQAEAEPDVIKELRSIDSVIDSLPVLPEDLWKTLLWFGSTWFAGLGMAAKTLLPSKFLGGSEVGPMPVMIQDKHPASGVRYVYEPRDVLRYGIYADMTENSPDGSLVLFPEVLSAKRFWEMLPKSIREGGVLWSVSNPAKQWDVWKKTLAGEIKFVVGSQGASFLPLRGLSRIIVDDECSGGWRTQKHPIFHRRTLLAARARFAGAELVLGGRMPSSKAFMEMGPSDGKEGAESRLVFVNMSDSASFEVAAIKESIPISRPLMRETLDCRRRGEWAFWLLDRKGYAGEIYCRDCGAPVRCSMCGGTMRWEGRYGRLSCLNCRSRIPVPEKCPSCGGPFLEGTRPGVEALREKASSLLKYKGEEVLLFQDEGDKLPSCKTLMKDYPNGAVAIGTRKILALADELSLGMVGWIDADSEARATEYDARVKAFSLVWESLWRGGEPERRRVVIQSRRPGVAWQTGLRRGWRIFWEAELRYRKELALPPFVPMLKLEMPVGGSEKFVEMLEKYDIEYWKSDEAEDEIWIRTRSFGLLKKILEPWFHIRNTRIGFPLVLLNLD